MRGVLVLAAFVVISAMPSFAAAAPSRMGAISQAPLSEKDALKGEELVRLLAGPAERRPILLHVGFKRLFRSGHIPGSRYVGAASTSDGLAGLRKATQGIGRDRDVVVYCGCCPWKDCPNVLPAVRELQRLGFKNVRALHLPEDFFIDWADRGRPVAKGD